MSDVILLIFSSSRLMHYLLFFFSSRRRHTRSKRDWSSDVCSSDLCYSHSNRWDGNRGGNHTHWKRITSSDVPTTEEQHRLIERSPIPNATIAPNKKAEGPCISGEGDREGIEKRCNMNASEIDKQQANYH